MRATEIYKKLRGDHIMQYLRLPHLQSPAFKTSRQQPQIRVMDVSALNI